MAKRRRRKRNNQSVTYIRRNKVAARTLNEWTEKWKGKKTTDHLAGQQIPALDMPWPLSDPTKRPLTTRQIKTNEPSIEFQHNCSYSSFWLFVRLSVVTWNFHLSLLFFYPHDFVQISLLLLLLFSFECQYCNYNWLLLFGFFFSSKWLLCLSISVGSQRFAHQQMSSLNKHTHAPKPQDNQPVIAIARNWLLSPISRLRSNIGLCVTIKEMSIRRRTFLWSNIFTGGNEDAATF